MKFVGFDSGSIETATSLRRSGCLGLSAILFVIHAEVSEQSEAGDQDLPSGSHGELADIHSPSLIISRQGDVIRVDSISS